MRFKDFFFDRKLTDYQIGIRIGFAVFLFYLLVMPIVVGLSGSSDYLFSCYKGFIACYFEHFLLLGLLGIILVVPIFFISLVVGYFVKKKLK